MLQPSRHTASARVLRRFALLVLMGAAAVLIAPCKMIDDQLLDVSLHRSAAGECFENCAKQYKEGVRNETERHLDALQACGDDSTCRKTEWERFRAALESLEQAARRCREECHHQGSGSGR